MIHFSKNMYYAHYQDNAAMPYPVIANTSGTGIPGNSALSFIQTGVRTYFPRLGRYMQVDPARYGINWVMYCGDNPINYIDPEGEATRFIATLSKGAKIRCTDWDKKIARVILGTAISGGAGSVAILAGAQPATVAGTVVVAFVVSLLAEFCPNPIYVWQRTCSGTFDIIYYDVQPTSDPANSYPRPTGKIDKNSKRSIVQTKFQKSRPSEKPYPSAHDFIPSEGL